MKSGLNKKYDDEKPRNANYFTHFLPKKPMTVRWFILVASMIIISLTALKSEENDFPISTELIIVTPRYDDQNIRMEKGFLVNTSWLDDFPVYIPPKGRLTHNGLEFGMYFQYLCHEYDNFPDKM